MIFTKKDNHYIDFVRNTRFLQENTKQVYLRRYEVIKRDIYKKPFDYILKHPNMFMKKLDEYAKNQKGRVGNQELSLHTKDGYISAIKALFIYNQDLKETAYDLLQKWENVHNLVRLPIDEKYKSNKPTIRQEAGYMSFDDIIKTRSKLKDGSIEKLLITMYTDIPPVRSDFYSTKICFINSEDDEDDLKKNMKQDENFVMINKSDHAKSKLILRKYKTVKNYKEIDIELTDEIVKQILYSLEKNKRDYLFVGKDNKPFEKENSFNSFANRLLKKTLNNQNFSLCMFRHSYISREDLKLEEKSGLAQDKIAKIMGHSISQQAKYRWNIWLKERK